MHPGDDGVKRLLAIFNHPASGMHAEFETQRDLFQVGRRLRASASLRATRTRKTTHEHECIVL